MAFDRSTFSQGFRASLPVLLGIVPFGVITGVAMVASGIPPLAAMAMSVFVFAGASMVATARLLVGYLQADNVYGLTLARFAEPHAPSTDEGRLAYFLGAGIPIWLAWQA